MFERYILSAPFCLKMEEIFFQNYLLKTLGISIHAIDYSDVRLSKILRFIQSARLLQHKPRYDSQQFEEW
jgi:hypothetical protein